MSDTAWRVKRLIADLACRDIAQVLLADTLDTLSFSSLDTVELVLDVERDLAPGAIITDDNWAAVATVGDIVALVERVAR